MRRHDGRATGVLLIQHVPPDDEHEAHVWLGGPLGGAVWITAEHARHEAERLLVAARWLDAINSIEPPARGQATLWGET